MAAPIYAYKGKGYNVMNVLDPEVGGEITARLFPEGEKPWVDQIRDNFLHPSSESLIAYIATPLGACLPVSIKPQVGEPPARGEAILFSSEESTGSSHGLIHRSTRAGQRARPAQASGVMLHLSPQLRSPRLPPLNLGKKSLRRKISPMRRFVSIPLSHKFLDYVVVSGSLSGLDVGMKRHATGDEEDQATLTQMMEKKRKLLADEKRELDAQAALDF
ncbi:hypothetical protein HanLR1_Chr00c0866g0778101 [Helianthus annuus]|nr:hypothetical protein HanLR1_Chr00c0866g0778101 [Helianthus annuus]